MTITLSTLDELSELTKQVAGSLRTGNVLALNGELGAGKTTFTQHLAKHLGIKTLVSSPTFGLMHQFDLPKGQIFYHLDLYRLKNLNEVLQIGLAEVIEEKKGYVVIEWSELARPVLPQDTIWIEMRILEDQTREITFTNFKY